MSDALSQVVSKGEVNEPNERINSANVISECPSDQDNEIKQSSSSDTAGSYADYEKYITRDEDGMAIYTDPTTNYEYIFDSDKNQWIPKNKDPANNPYENEHYRWCTETKEWILKDGASEQAENPYVNEHYKWNPETNKWETKNDDQRFTTSVFVDGQHLYTDADGTVYFWDDEKKAWFPKIDDDFMAMYQTNYGFIDNTSTKETTPSSPQVDETKSPTDNENDRSENESHIGKRKANQPQWFDESPEKCTKVYVSNLPDDITEDEFVEIMSKCGMIFRDPKTKKIKIKLYAEPNGQLKGDGLVHYIRVESVKLAIDMLDGYDIRGRKIKVQRAQFQMRGEYNPALKPKRKKQDKEKLKKLQEKLLDWRPDKMRGERSKHERVVIIKNLFEPEIFHNHFDLIIEYQNDLRDECSKCGTVKKIIVYSSEPEGVAEVRMSDPEEADLVVQMMNRRYFGKRMLSAELWDGKKTFKANETEDEFKERLSKWDEFLEADDNDNKSASASTPTTDTETKAD